VTRCFHFGRDCDAHGPIYAGRNLSPCFAGSWAYFVINTAPLSSLLGSADSSFCLSGSGFQSSQASGVMTQNRPFPFCGQNATILT